MIIICTKSWKYTTIRQIKNKSSNMWNIYCTSTNIFNVLCVLKSMTKTKGALWERKRAWTHPSAINPLKADDFDEKFHIVICSWSTLSVPRTCRVLIYSTRRSSLLVNFGSNFLDNRRRNKEALGRVHSDTNRFGTSITVINAAVVLAIRRKLPLLYYTY